jgi:ABC-type uncharacterized transport system permease subunit
LEILLGRVAAPDIFLGYAIQLAWLAAAITAMRLAWAAGVKQFSAVGT